MGVVVVNRSLRVGPVGVLNPVIVNICHKAVLLEVMGHHFNVITMQVVQPRIVVDFLHIMILVVVAGHWAEVLFSQNPLAGV